MIESEIAHKEFLRWLVLGYLYLLFANEFLENSTELWNDGVKQLILLIKHSSM